MGLHNLPAYYDAMRLTPPEDMRPARRARFAHEVTVAILPNVDWAADMELEATFSDKGQMLTVQMGGYKCAPHDFELMVGIPEFERICEAAEDEIAERLREEEADAEADWADHQNDLRRDH